jgi:hypothetical protein
MAGWGFRGVAGRLRLILRHFQVVACYGKYPLAAICCFLSCSQRRAKLGLDTAESVAPLRTCGWATWRRCGDTSCEGAGECEFLRS